MSGYLTIEEKKQLALEGKSVPVCVHPDEREKRRRRKERRKLINRFSKNLSN